MKKITSLKTALVCISILVPISTLKADLNDINQWNYLNSGGYGSGDIKYSSPVSGLFESTADGITIRTNSSRGAGFLISKQTFTLAGSTVDFTWSGSGGSSFSQPVLGAEVTQWPTDAGASEVDTINGSYGNSYNGSWVASPGALYHTKVDISGSSYSSTTTETTSGNIVETKSGSYDFTAPLHLLFRQGDTYDAGNSYMALKNVSLHANFDTSPPPVYTQAGASWSSDRLIGSSHSDDTIGNYGCMVSAASIILNSYGHYVDPGQLNQYLSQTIPNDNGLFAFNSIPASTTYGQTDGTTGTPVAFHSQTLELGLTRSETASELGLQIANSGPLLLRVPQYKHGLEDFPGNVHAIVAWKVEGDEIFIRNPGSARTGISVNRNIDSLTLDDYISYVNSSVVNPTFQLDTDFHFLLGQQYTYATAAINNSNSTLRGAVHSPVEFVITDSLGRRLGFDPTLGLSYNEIPSSFYGRLSSLVSPDGNLMQTSGSSNPIDFELGTLVSGEYKLEVYGIGSGDWSINLGLNDQSGFNPNQYLFSGLASTTSYQLYTFSVPEPSAYAMYAVLGGVVGLGWLRRRNLS